MNKHEKMDLTHCYVTKSKQTIPITCVVEGNFSNWLNQQNAFVKKWLSSIRFRAEAGNASLIPSEQGQLQQVVVCIKEANHFWGVGSLPCLLPEGVYEFENITNPLFYLAWGLGAYQFTHYKKATRNEAKLLLPAALQKSIQSLVQSIYWVRDLINFPTEEMGPSELGKAASQFAKTHGLKINQIVGNDLLKKNYPLIHLVGRASDDAPRLIDLRWGNTKHPKVTLVGKGVCFDSGGLDIKPAAGMLLMKKDMGGAAHVLGLAKMIVEAKLPIQLRVLIPAVENVISGNAYRPGDVVRSRKGLTIEIGNTDGEGRLVLADALAEAVADKPDLLIDIATLTGAARVALGTELPAFFCNDDKLAEKLMKSSTEEQDFIWRMPLFNLYRDSLISYIADINNSSFDGYGSAITAALFLKEFVPDSVPWVHYDLMAWNLKSRPGRPMGGEAMGLRGLLSYLTSRFKADI